VSSTRLPPRLSVRGLSKSFGAARVLDGIDFDADSGRVLALAGENGSGKSTTFNILAGVLPRDAGEIWLDGRPFNPSSPRDSSLAGLRYIHQELNIFPNLSIAENLFIVEPPRAVRFLPLIARRRMHERARALLEQVDLTLDPQAAAGTLSVGERQLLEIARALQGDVRVLILDEPTTSLTEREVRRLFAIIDHLRTRDVAMLFVSHNLEHVRELADDVVVLRDGAVTLQSHDAKQLTAHDLVLSMVGRPIEAQFSARVPRRPAAPVLQVTGLSEPGVLKGIHLSVAAGEIVGLAGLMGSGRSELARTIFGLEPHREGEILIEGRRLPPGDVRSRLDARIAFLTEDRRRDGLFLDAMVADNLALVALSRFTTPPLGRIDRAALTAAVDAMGSRVKLKGTSEGAMPVRRLSGGNQQKVVLGRWLLSQPRIFILDEPTRGIDVGAKQDIYRLFAALSEAGVALLIVSSELEELLGLCDRILVMHRGQIAASFVRTEFDRLAILRAAFGQVQPA
jgi:ribose transport system ATP-binding protein